ncbi:MAG TPA: peptidase domain-containing ABC transporter [Steroidobacteraceae bacterium]|nr:peptidase domain-containing ABC transporter [Steroidobacteraceae bacterium]
MSADLQLGFFRRGKVRLVRQTEAAECGLACLAMAADFHGLQIDLGNLRRRFAISLRGAPLRLLIRLAEKLGMTARAVKLPLESLPNLQVPALLHWDMDHYVLLEEANPRRALIHDPAGSSKWLDTAEVSKHFTGVALELSPSDDFETGQFRERLRLRQLWRRVSGMKRALLQTLVLTLILQCFVLVSPYYMQIALDTALPAMDADLMTVLALGFGLFTLVNVATSVLRSFVLLAAGTSLSFGIATNLARRLFRLPVSWFEKRHVGDILSRFQSVGPLQQALTQGMLAGMIDGTLAIVTIAVLIYYSTPLAMLAVAACGLYLLVRLVSFPHQREAQEAAIIAGSKEQSTLIETLRGIVTLRLYDKETERHAHWQSKLTGSVNAGVGIARIGIWVSAANGLIFGLEAIFSTWLAVSFVMQGGFSVGMLFAFAAYKTQFLSRASSLLDQVIAFRMLGLHLERLSDIALSPQDVSFRESESASRRLEGRIELRDICFRYGEGEANVLTSVCLSVEPGDYVAIVGPSGEGKSTLIKILLGLLEPDSGDFLIDGIPARVFGFTNYRRQVGAVLQDDHLFSGTIGDNIALFEDCPDTARIVAASTTAAVHEEIARMPMGYETLVGEMGSALSGGQRQRILLARALYRRPRLLVMDEGTSHIDLVREKQINDAISEMGITRIIVAHRPQTISCAKTIVEMVGGKVSLERASRAINRLDT